MTNYQVERVVKGERSGFFFGPYKVLYLVGAGTFARVFRAVHRRPARWWRSRRCGPATARTRSSTASFVREGRVGCTLRHPNIVPIFEVVSQGKQHFLVMEFVEGWNLQDFVRIRKKVEPRQATKLMIDMTEGLRYAFEHGLTHRDLKLNNVLVSSAGQAKLVDFGLAAMDEAIADDALADLPNTRTVDYAALERATGVRKDDTRSDIYFLGCIFYHMLTGQAPLSETRDRLQRLSKQRFLEVTPIQNADPTLPHWVTLVVNKAMMLDPSRRYQSPSAMLADLHIAATQLAAGEDAAAAQASAKPADSHTAPARTNRSDRHGRGIEPADAGHLPRGFKTGRLPRAGDQRPGPGRRPLSPGRHGRRLRALRRPGNRRVGPGRLQQLGEDTKTHFVRAICSLDEPQHGWAKNARVAAHRKVLSMPITMKQLRTALAELMGDRPGS